MRTANLNHRLVIIDEDTAVDVEAAGGGLFSSDPQAVFDRWNEFRACAGSRTLKDAERQVLDEAALRAPVPRPRHDRPPAWSAVSLQPRRPVRRCGRPTASGADERPVPRRGPDLDPDGVRGRTPGSGPRAAHQASRPGAAVSISWAICSATRGTWPSQ